MAHKAFNGAEVKIICPTCHGTGKVSPKVNKTPENERDAGSLPEGLVKNDEHEPKTPSQPKDEVSATDVTRNSVATTDNTTDTSQSDQMINDNEGLPDMNDKFNWQKFHKDLDTALATWFIETSNSSIHRELFDFLKFSSNKQMEAQIKSTPDPNNTKENK